MGPLLWWWRWWTGIDPDREKALVGARESIERQQARVEQLSSELEVRDTKIAALQKQLDQSDGERQRLQARQTELEGDGGELSRLRARIDELDQATAEADRLRARIDELEQTTAEADRLRSQVDELRAELTASAARRETSTADAGEPDVSEAASVLGTRIKLDDFTVIEGIGPKIADLLHDAGITTWRQLSEADPADLRRVLTEAGSRFRLHDPTNWPAQAALLTHGRWQEFKDLTAKLREQRAG
jgi:predicted flap endonuclease-1-like 5' DNA nuclease